jgi:predicted O-methyltransferase YrrM
MGRMVYRTFLSRRAHLGLDSVIVPLRMTFDEARYKVPDQIDLLHIDGLHTWEAVNHDFEMYGPLVRPGGLVLFHDVNADFEGMRRFWRMVSGRYVNHMVPYSSGLGIIRV